MPAQTPIARLLARKDSVLHDGRLGLLCNHASFDVQAGAYLFQLLARRGNLHRVFVPEHGLFAELQDQQPVLSPEVYGSLEADTEFVSLYGQTEDSLVAGPATLSDLDALIVDLQDVGSRYYTFATTLGYLLGVLAKQPSPPAVFLIDRPIPAGCQVEGTLLRRDDASFVGPPGLPHRHGLTIAELARFHWTQAGRTFNLEIVPLLPARSEPDAPPPRGTPWEIPPSPNMPGPLTPLVYPGQCLLEGTNISEGRGTTRPFETFGAPYMHWIYTARDLPDAPGAVLRPLRFVPTFHKHAGSVCHGFQIHLTDARRHSPYTLALALYQALYRLYGNHFEYKQPPYEYEYERLPMDLILGDKGVREAIEAGNPIGDIVAGWASPLAAYQEMIEAVYLY